MNKRAETRPGTQGPTGSDTAITTLMAPLVAGMTATRERLLEWVHACGLVALRTVFRDEAATLAGPKGHHQRARTHHHWGTTGTELTLGGRRVRVTRPRVRRTTGGEVPLPSVVAFRARDPLTTRVLQQLLLGVSTRGYDGSLEASPAGVRTRGSSKSAVSRTFVARTRGEVQAQLSRRLEALDLLALFVDGIEVAGQTVVVALGITRDGAKEPLGLCLGSTENAGVCTQLLQDLLARGLTLPGRLLCVIDGGKGLRKALQDVFGTTAVLQRCQLHKQRNVLALVPQTRHAYVGAALRRAYRARSAGQARRQLTALGTWLEHNGHIDAAASLREGLEETLTGLKLGLPPTLRRFFTTTNCIENLIATVRHVARNVTRWRDGTMIRRWVGLGLVQAATRFRRINGHRELATLATALGPREASDRAA